MQKKIIMVAFLVASILIGILPNVIIPVGKAAPPNRINDAITRGLNYLNSTQASDGSWGGPFPAACTAMAVLAFENFGHLPGNLSDPYHATVEKGLDYLFTQSYAQPIGVQPAGNPDVSGDGIGIQFGSYTGYETPMALIAIVASQSKSRIATTGPAGVIGRNYHDIVQDIVDWIAWAQTDPGNIYEGGWRYTANYGSSDMSVTQWSVLGLMTAELWNITARDWVRTELAKWLAVDQVLTGDPTSNYFYGSFMYEPYNQLYDIVDTAAGIGCLTYCGTQTSDPRIIAAEGYITRDWYTSSGWRENFGDLYAMYGIMKTMRLTQPEPTNYTVDYNGVPTIEWYNGTGQYADYLVNNQQPDGHWIGTTNPEEGETGANLNTAFGTLILIGTPAVVKYKLTVRVIDPDIISPVSEATVLAVVGPESPSGITDIDGIVVFNETQAGLYVVSALKPGYITVNETVYLAEDTNITMELAQAGPFNLTVSVVDSCSLPINNALVEAANTTVYSNASGIASFELPRGSYNVTASDLDYQSASWLVDLHGDKNITLTLAYPYVFQGEIPDSNIVLQPVASGYNITLLNSLLGSGMDVFFDWEHVGTILAGSWQSFNFNHLPNLIVEAALKGSVDYPHAWDKHPLPIQLVPTTGQEGAFLPEPVPYAAGSIFVIPYPPVYGENTTIGVTLHDPFNYPLNISRIDFQISSLTIGGYFTSVGYLSNITLQANETNSFSITWLATVSGHHCVRVVLTYSPESQTMQRNMDIESNVLQGQTGEAEFTLTNPYETDKTITLKVSQTLPPDWQTELEINGLEYSTSSDITLDVAAGGELDVTLKIESSSTEAGQAIVDVQGYIDRQPIGGVRKTLQTLPAGTPCLQVLHYSISPSVPREGQTFFIYVTAKNAGGTTLQSPQYLDSVSNIPGSDAVGQPPEFSASLIGPSTIAPGQTVSLEYSASTTWNFAAPPTFLNTLLNSYIQLGLSALLDGLVGVGKDAYENFLLQHFFTEGGQTKLTYWIIKNGIDQSVLVAKGGLEDVKDIQDITGIVYMFEKGGLTLGVNYYLAFPNTGYAIDYSPLEGDSINVYVFASQSKINTALQAQRAELEALGISVGLGVASAATLPLATTLVGAIVPGALLAGSILVSTCTQAWYQSQMADPSPDYAEYVVVQPPPTLITSLSNSSNGRLIYDEYMVEALMNASVESMARACGAMKANSSYYAYMQMSLAERYAESASVYWQDLMTGLNALITQLNSTNSLNETAFLEGQHELASQGLPQNVSLLLQAMNLSSFVNLTQLEGFAYSPINITAIVSIPSAPGNIEMDDESIMSQNPLARYDAAVIDVTPYRSWTYQGSQIDVNVTTANPGDFTENATVNLFYNGTAVNSLIGKETVLLAPNQTETVTFTWNTTGVPPCYSGYNLTALADISPKIDSNMTNNVLQSPLTVEIRILCDINGDGIVDISDIALAAMAFMSTPGEPRWNPIADINLDGMVDMLDIALIASMFGHQYL